MMDKEEIGGATLTCLFDIGIKSFSILFHPSIGRIISVGWLFGIDWRCPE
jgi:hypothetical protein